MIDTKEQQEIESLSLGEEPEEPEEDNKQEGDIQYGEPLDIICPDCGAYSPRLLNIILDAENKLRFFTLCNYCGRPRSFVYVMGSQIQPESKQSKTYIG